MAVGHLQLKVRSQSHNLVKLKSGIRLLFTVSRFILVFVFSFLLFEIDNTRNKSSHDVCKTDKYWPIRVVCQLYFEHIVSEAKIASRLNKTK